MPSGEHAPSSDSRPPTPEGCLSAAFRPPVSLCNECMDVMPPRFTQALWRNEVGAYRFFLPCQQLQMRYGRPLTNRQRKSLI